MKRYADMLLLPHPVSKKRAQMSAHDRAAQFAPFAALTGYEDAIGEAGRLTEHAVSLTEDSVEELNMALCTLQTRFAHRPTIGLTYFRPDARKAGGAILTISGIADKIDRDRQILILEDGTRVPFEDLLQLHFLAEKEKI